MIHPNPADFQQLSKGVSYVPLYTKIMGDCLTPVMAYQRIRSHSPYAYLLESVQQDEKLGRYSFIGLNPLATLESNGDASLLTLGDGSTEDLQGSPFTMVEEVMQRFQPAILEELAPFSGSMVGFLGYDCIRHIEEIPQQNPDDLQIPEATLVLPRTVIMFDHLYQTVTLIEMTKAGDTRDLERAEHALQDLLTLLSFPQQERHPTVPEEKEADPEYRSNMTKEEFEAIVNKAKHYITEGDIFQVVLAQRFEMDYEEDPFLIYRALRRINPSPYLFYLQFPKFQIAGSSPEVLVKKEGDTLTLRPIAGTRKRGKTPEADAAMRDDLLGDPKEIAEHMMLVDLGRNDLGRVSKFGTVEPTKFKYIENYSHVMHIVTNLESKAAEGIPPSEILQSCFPAGTLSGAPKIRAMEIIEELEVSKRGFYGGIVLHQDYTGDFDSCIGIRSVVIKDNKAYMQAGAGVVADSIPELEYKECINKARPLLKAIEQCKGGQEA